MEWIKEQNYVVEKFGSGSMVIGRVVVMGDEVVIGEGSGVCI